MWADLFSELSVSKGIF